MCTERPAINYTQFPSDQEIYVSKKISFNAAPAAPSSSSASPSTSPSTSASTSSSASASAAAGTTSPAASSSSSGISKGAIAGIVLGVLVLVALLLGACLFCLRRKRRAASAQHRANHDALVEAPAHEQKPEYYQYNTASPATATTYASSHGQHGFGDEREQLHEAPGPVAAFEAGETGHPVELPAGGSGKK